MKAIVIYNSQTGFTKRYAEWIAEATGCECVEFKEGAKKDLSEYDAIVFGGWCMAGGITKLSWFKKQIPSLAAAGKKLLVYAVGASPIEAPDVEIAMRRNFTDEERSQVKVVYCPGGLDYEKMNKGSKIAMKMFVKILSLKKNPTPADLEQVEMVSHSYNISDKKYIEPIITELK